MNKGNKGNQISDHKLIARYENSIGQWWATLFGSRATLATNLVYTGQYKYNKDLFDLAFERKWVFKVHFLKRSILSGILNVFSTTLKPN